jgi:hypothetical protein
MKDFSREQQADATPERFAMAKTLTTTAGNPIGDESS